MLNPADLSFTYCYKSFIESKNSENINPFDKILFKGWVKSFYLVVIDKGFRLSFIFANIKESQREYSLPLMNNVKGYKCFCFQNLENFPKEFLKLIKKRGLIYSNDYAKRQRTTVQRLICALKYDINSKHIHHINHNIDDNCISNLIPIAPEIHKDFHKSKSGENFLKILDSLENNRFNNRFNYSRQRNDFFIVFILLARYAFKINIDDLSRIKSLKHLSVCTVKTILRDFRDFKFYFPQLKS